MMVKNSTWLFNVPDYYRMFSFDAISGVVGFLWLQYLVVYTVESLSSFISFLYLDLYMY